MADDFEKGDAVWICFGEGFSSRFHWPWPWWWHDDGIVRAVVLDVFDDDMLVVEYADDRFARHADWFTADQARQQIRRRSEVAT